MFLTTQIKTVLHSRLQDTESLALIERDKEKYVKKLLVEDGGAKEESLQWMSFPDGDELFLLTDGTRPHRNSFRGPWFDYRLARDKNVRMVGSGEGLDRWIAEVTANGEVVERIWPPE